MFPFFSRISCDVTRGTEISVYIRFVRKNGLLSKHFLRAEQFLNVRAHSKVIWVDNDDEGGTQGL